MSSEWSLWSSEGEQKESAASKATVTDLTAPESAPFLTVRSGSTESRALESVLGAIGVGELSSTFEEQGVPETKAENKPTSPAAAAARDGKQWPPGSPRRELCLLYTSPSPRDRG